MSTSVEHYMAMFSFTIGKLENRQFFAQNAPDCTKLRLKFQNCPWSNTLTPPPLGASRLDSTFGHSIVPPESFIYPLKQNKALLELIT